MVISPRTHGAFEPADVLPPGLVAMVERLDVRSRRVLAGKLQGERRSKRRGRSVEFEDYRAYATGDDLRHIDWNVYARLDRFFIKVFQEEEDMCVRLVLDASASMTAGDPSKLLVACRVLAAMGCLALTSNNRVSLLVLGLPASAASELHGTAPGGVFVLPAARGREGVVRLTQTLCRVLNASSDAALDANASTVANASQGFSAALKLLASGAEGLGGGKGVVVLTSDLLVPAGAVGPARFGPGYAPGLRLLAADAGFDTLVVQTLTPGELDPAKELGGTNRAVVTGDLRLIDAESGKGLEITVSAEAIRAYRQRADRYVQGVQSLCASLGIRHALLTTDTDVSDFVLGPLRRSGVLG